MGPPPGFKENVILRAEGFKEKAITLNLDIRLEELSVFVYTKTKGDKT